MIFFRGSRGPPYPVGEGEWSDGLWHGKGLYSWSGKKQMGFHEGDVPVGEAVRWSRDGQKAWRLWDGKVVEAIDLDYAQEIADMIGLPVPTFAPAGGTPAPAPATPSKKKKKKKTGEGDGTPF